MLVSPQRDCCIGFERWRHSALSVANVVKPAHGMSPRGQARARARADRADGRSFAFVTRLCVVEM